MFDMSMFKQNMVNDTGDKNAGLFISRMGNMQQMPNNMTGQNMQNGSNYISDEQNPNYSGIYNSILQMLNNR